jgi:phosphomevalonate kinase
VAAVLGGFVAYSLAHDDYQTARIAWPESARISVVWTGVEARTSELLRRVNLLRNGDPARHDALTARIARAADALIGAARRGDASGIVEAARAHGEAMTALGDASGAPIVEPRLREVMRLAAGAGGAAKPSGAGGGDVAVAFFADAAAEARFEGACAKRDFTLLSLALGEGGLARERE